MKPRTKLRWPAAPRALDPALNELVFVAVGQRRRLGWHCGRITATAEPLEKHRLVWAAGRGDYAAGDAEAAPLWGSRAGGCRAERRRKA